MAHSFCTAVKRLSESKKCRQDCLMSSAQSFYGPCLQSVVHSLTCCLSGMCHSSTRPGMSYHVTQFYQAFPRVSTASNKCWGEKAWVRGYVFVVYLVSQSSSSQSLSLSLRNLFGRAEQLRDRPCSCSSLNLTTKTSTRGEACHVTYYKDLHRR